MNRRALIVSLFVLGLSGLAFGAWPFLASLSPSATAGETLPHLKVGGLSPGEYAYFDGGTIGRLNQYQYLVLRQFDSSYDVFVIQTKDGSFLMPDINFWNISGTCNHFSLPMPRGRLAQNGDARCLDSNVEGGNNDNWRWNYKGRNINKFFADFLHPQFVVEGNEIVVGKWR